MATPAASPICFGDVVKLNVNAGDGAVSCLGFLEHKNDEFLLIVPPVKESASAKYQEAEFIVAPTRGDKPPALGTPLNYKQSFVLLTSSQFEDYSLNNKMNGNDTIGLQCRDVKGEMYLAIEKEGYTLEANVMDGDEGLDLVVVDSNRIRKQYNNKFGFYTKKSDVLGGYVSCGSKKNKPLNFTINKVAGESKTKQFIQKQIPRRRRSTLTNDPTKADETTRASRVGSDVSDGSALSPTGAVSPVAAPVAETKPSEEPAATAAPAVASVESPAAATPAAGSASNHKPRISTASTTESAASVSEVSVASPAPAAPAVAVVPVATPVTAAAAPLVDLLSEVSLEEKVPKKSSALMSPMVLVPEATNAVASSTTTAATVPASTVVPAADAAKPAAKEESVTAPVAAVVWSPVTAGQGAKATDAKPADSKPATATASKGVIPQYVPPSPKKLGQQPSALTVTSEAEGTEEKLDSSCIGGRECSIM